MHPIKLLAALGSLAFVSASPRPTSPQPSEAHKTLLFWEPESAYENRPKTRVRWEDTCDKVLAKAGCDVGLIHQGQTKVAKPNGEKTYYVNVHGAPLNDMENTKRMHVFQDGSFEEVRRWSWWDRRSMTHAKRARKTRQPHPGQNEPTGVFLFWDPQNSYDHIQLKRSFWERRCDEALTKEDCLSGIIHKGETNFTKPTGEKTSYLNVEGISSTRTKLMRVFQDGSSTEGWSDRDRRLMAKAKGPKGQDRGRAQKHQNMKHAKQSVEASTREHSPSQGSSKHEIVWDPPDAYPGSPFLKKSFERACQQALDREGCDFAMIHQGNHRIKEADGTKTQYMNVSMGKKDEPNSTNYIRVFEDGMSWRYPPGPLPRKDLERHRSGAQIRPPHKLPQGRPRKQWNVSTHAQGSVEDFGKRPREQESNSPDEPGSSERMRKRLKKKESIST